VNNDELKQGVDLKDQDALDKLVIKNLTDSAARLPSNFSYRVMQKIAQLKVERARSDAVSQSVLVSLTACLLGAGLFMLYAFYRQMPLMAGFPMPADATLLPIGGGLILLMLIVFDGFFAPGLTESSNRE
jgi:hypothetical protein